MIETTLTRFYTPGDMGTFGIWTFPYSETTRPGMTLATVEKPWAGNKPMVSCIREGHYVIYRDKRPKQGDCFCLINHTLGVSRYPEVGMIRHSILVHIANYASDVEGCIGPGTDVSANGGHWMVTHSRDAMLMIDRWLGKETEFNLTIKQYQPEGMK